MIARHFVMRLINKFRRAKGQLSPTKWKYLDGMISKIYGMRMNHYFTYGYCYYYDVWAGVGFQETQPPKLVIR